MASNLFICLLLLPLALHLSTVSAQQRAVHVVTITFPITITITTAGKSETTNVLPGQEYRIDVTNPNAVISANVKGNGTKSALFNVYDPARDQAAANVYWKATIRGFEISYDTLTWKQLVSWK